MKPLVNKNTVFFRVIEDVFPYKAGEIIAKSLWHCNFIVIANPKLKTEYNLSRVDNIGKTVGAEVTWSLKESITRLLRKSAIPLERWELEKVYPHLTKTLKGDADWVLTGKKWWEKK